MHKAELQQFSYRLTTNALIAIFEIRFVVYLNCGNHCSDCLIQQFFSKVPHSISLALLRMRYSEVQNS
jgi:hypothetical protein